MVDVLESAAFRRWIRGLRDRAAVARINGPLRRISLANAGDAGAVRKGLFETRVHHGPGCRL